MSTNETIDVVCFKWGDLYGADEVNRLHGMFRRHLSVPQRLHCLTDDPAGLHSDIVVHPLPAYDFCDWDIGVARKLVLFSDDFLGLNGRNIIYCDLDMVLIADVSFLLDWPEENFLLGRGRNQASNARGHAAVMRHRAGSMTAVWEDFVRDPAGAVATCQHHRCPPGHVNDQIWIDRQVADMRFFEDGRIVYFRQDCNAFTDQENPAGIATPPEGARIVSFAGRVKMQHVRDGSYQTWRHAPFVAEHWKA